MGKKKTRTGKKLRKSRKARNSSLVAMNKAEQKPKKKVYRTKKKKKVYKTSIALKGENESEG